MNRLFTAPSTFSYISLPAYIAWFIARLEDRQTAQNDAWQRMLAA
jgi:hypothetical protein